MCFDVMKAEGSVEEEVEVRDSRDCPVGVALTYNLTLWHLKASSTYSLGNVNGTGYFIKQSHLLSLLLNREGRRLDTDISGHLSENQDCPGKSGTVGIYAFIVPGSNIIVCAPTSVEREEECVQDGHGYGYIAHHLELNVCKLYNITFE